MAYKYWKKLNETVYQTKNGEIVEETKDWTTVQKVQAVIKESQEPNGGIEIVFVSVNIDDDTGDAIEPLNERIIKTGFKDKEEARSYLSDILENTPYSGAIMFVEGEFDLPDLENTLPKLQAQGTWQQDGRYRAVFEQDWITAKLEIDTDVAPANQLSNEDLEEYNGKFYVNVFAEYVRGENESTAKRQETISTKDDLHDAVVKAHEFMVENQEREDVQERFY